jgi:hypothetical protein
MILIWSGDIAIDREYMVLWGTSVLLNGSTDNG